MSFEILIIRFIKKGHLAILKGNLASEGCVAKISGIKNPVLKGPARIFESEEDCLKSILNNDIKAGNVVVIRMKVLWADQG